MSVVYSVTCACGDDLGHKCFLDKDEDLTIDIDKCERCAEANYDEGYAKGEEDATE